jgi:hypothetical protein
MQPGKINSKIFASLLIVTGVLVLSSCDSNRWFQSEDTLNAKIQTSWTKIRMTTDPNVPTERWTFSGGNVERMKLSPTDTVIDNGHYSISTSLSKAYLNITDFTILTDELNGKWEILELDGGILFIATDHDGASGVKQLEFEEK